jgi:hypothetical protein
MAFIDDCLANERDERDARIKDVLYEQFPEGKTDAAFGRMLEYNDETYLEAYIAEIKEPPADPETKKIQHYSPRKHFAFGWVDGDLKYRDQFGEF